MDQLELFRLLQPYIHRPENIRIQPHVVHPVGLDIVKTLMTMNLWLIDSIVAQSRMRPFDEAVQWGSLGLEKGILRFDPERGLQPPRFLAHWIRSYARRVWDEPREMERVPRNISDRGRFSPERAAYANELYEVWRVRLAQAEQYARKRHAESDVLLFGSVTGYAHPTQPPKPYQEIAVMHGVSRALVNLRVNQVMRTFAQACLLPREEFEPVLSAMVEYSLEKDLPL